MGQAQAKLTYAKTAMVFNCRLVSLDFGLYLRPLLSATEKLSVAEYSSTRVGVVVVVVVVAIFTMG